MLRTDPFKYSKLNATKGEQEKESDWGVILSPLTQAKRNSLKVGMDEFCTFNWRNTDVFETFGAFIISDKGGLKFYNGPSFSNTYSTPQYNKSALLEGVTFKTQQIKFKIGVYWISEEDYRKFINWLDPYVISTLSFGYDAYYGYRVKLASREDSPRYTVGYEDNDTRMYYTEMNLTFEIQGDPVAIALKSYEFTNYDNNTNTYSINEESMNDNKESDLPYPIKMTYRLPMNLLEYTEIPPLEKDFIANNLCWTVQPEEMLVRDCEHIGKQKFYIDNVPYVEIDSVNHIYQKFNAELNRWEIFDMIIEDKDIYGIYPTPNSVFTVGNDYFMFTGSSGYFYKWEGLQWKLYQNDPQYPSQLIWPTTEQAMNFNNKSFLRETGDICWIPATILDDDSWNIEYVPTEHSFLFGRWESRYWNVYPANYSSNNEFHTHDIVFITVNDLIFLVYQDPSTSKFKWYGYNGHDRFIYASQSFLQNVAPKNVFISPRTSVEHLYFWVPGESQVRRYRVRILSTSVSFSESSTQRFPLYNLPATTYMQDVIWNSNKTWEPEHQQWLSVSYPNTEGYFHEYLWLEGSNGDIQKEIKSVRLFSEFDANNMFNFESLGERIEYYCDSDIPVLKWVYFKSSRKNLQDVETIYQEGYLWDTTTDLWGDKTLAGTDNHLEGDKIINCGELYYSPSDSEFYTIYVNYDDDITLIPVIFEDQNTGDMWESSSTRHVGRNIVHYQDGTNSTFLAAQYINQEIRALVIENSGWRSIYYVNLDVENRDWDEIFGSFFGDNYVTMECNNELMTGKITIAFDPESGSGLPTLQFEPITSCPFMYNKAYEINNQYAIYNETQNTWYFFINEQWVEKPILTPVIESSGHEIPCNSTTLISDWGAVVYENYIFKVEDIECSWSDWNHGVITLPTYPDIFAPLFVTSYYDYSDHQHTSWINYLGEHDQSPFDILEQEENQVYITLIPPIYRWINGYYSCRIHNGSNNISNNGFFNQQFSNEQILNSLSIRGTVWIDGKSDNQHTLFNLILDHLPFVTNTDYAADFSFEYDSESGIIYQKYGDGTYKLLNLWSTASTGEKIVRSMEVNKLCIPGQFDVPNLSTRDIRIQVQLFTLDTQEEFHLQENNVIVSAYGRTSLV